MKHKLFLVVTIIIPLFNRAHLIAFTLQSLEGSKHKGIKYEVIVVDDASNDGGAELVEKDFPWVKLVRNTVNKGAPACRNQGLELAKGEFVLFLDSDDLIERDFFLKKIDVFNEYPEVAGVYGPWDYFESEFDFRDVSIKPRFSRYPLYVNPEQIGVIKNILGGWYIPINAIVWRAKMVREIGGFRCHLLVNQDVDFCFRMVVKNAIIGVESSRALIRMHDSNTVGSLDLKNNLSEKLEQILSIREEMVKELMARDQYSNPLKHALASYCFSFWIKYRKTSPNRAEEFLKFSNVQYPELKLRGGIILKFLAFLLGKEKAIIIKQMFRH